MTHHNIACHDFMDINIDTDRVCIVLANMTSM